MSLSSASTRALRYLVTFRNGNHRAWFWFSSALGSAILACAILWGTREVFVPFASLHLGVSIRAANQCLVRRVPSEIYSVDCIWFNAVIAAIYVALCL